jgi:hypothetical protein
MAFRGYFALNGLEFANSSRVLAHIGKTIPTNDLVIGGTGDSCALTAYVSDSGLANLPATSAPLTSDSGLATPPDGSLKYDPGLVEVGDCWSPSELCGCVSTASVAGGDTWPDLMTYLQDTIYRVELAPWFNLNLPQSAEFGGVWVMDAKGFGPPATDRPVQEMVGSGATSSPHRFTSRKLSFDALLIACTNAGLEYGVQWLQCQLEATIDQDGVLRYFMAHPNTAADPDDLVRELHGVIMTQSVASQQAYNARGRPNQQATMYRVSFELTAQDPYAYLPPIVLSDITFDTITTENIAWVLTPCDQPSDCDTSPVLLSATAPPEQVTLDTTHPPPILGGELPVCQLERQIYNLPEFDTPTWCRETAVTITITNNSTLPLTLQAYWKNCTAPEECDTDQFPVQIAGLPPFCTIILDGITRRYSAVFANRTMIPMGIVGTPDGVPWTPPVIDRTQCWQFEVLAPVAADFSVELDLYDREA